MWHIHFRETVNFSFQDFFKEKIKKLDFGRKMEKSEGIET
jgi:hypothetical protein